MIKCLKLLCVRGNLRLLITAVKTHFLIQFHKCLCHLLLSFLTVKCISFHFFYHLKAVLFLIVTAYIGILRLYGEIIGKTLHLIQGFFPQCLIVCSKFIHRMLFSLSVYPFSTLLAVQNILQFSILDQA